MLAGFASDEVQRYERRISDGLVEVPDDFRDSRREFFGGDDLDHMLHADRRSGLRRDVDLRVALPLEAGGEGHQLLVMTTGERGNHGGVDTAREEGPDGHVGAHVLGDRILQRVRDPSVRGLAGVVRQLRRHLETRVEVADELALLSGAEEGVRAGLEAADALVERFVLGDVLQGDVVLQRPCVDRLVHAGDPREFGHRLLFGSDDRGVGSLGDVHRLDAEEITGHE